MASADNHSPMTANKAFKDDYGVCLREFRELRDDATWTASSGRPFVSVSQLVEHLTAPLQGQGRFRNKLDRLLKVSYLSLSDQPPPIIFDALKDYTLIFLTLLDIGSPHYVHLFNQRRVSDVSLPLSRDVLQRIPNLPFALRDHFHLAQYRYCPIEFDLDMAGWYGDRIEPFLRKDVISPGRDDIAPNDPDGAKLWAVSVPASLLSSRLQQVFDEPTHARQSDITELSHPDESRGDTALSPHSDEPSKSGHKTYECVIKQFPSQRRAQFDREMHAYQALKNVKGFLRQIGWYEVSEPQGQSAGESTLNLVLEKADFDLYTAMRVLPPPVLSSDIYTFWRSMLGLAQALASLHHVEIDGLSYDVWHGDIKPANILRVGQDYKLADPGEARMQLSAAGTEEAKAIVLGGTMTYGAPEKTSYLTGDSDKPAKILQSSDVWSLGCVFSAAATYVVLGHHGIHQYDQLRRLATDFRSDAFHDSKNVLKEIFDWHNFLRASVRKSDRLTSQIIDVVEKHMMVISAENRWHADRVSETLESLLRDHPSTNDSTSLGWSRPHDHIVSILRQSATGAIKKSDKTRIIHLVAHRADHQAAQHPTITAPDLGLQRRQESQSSISTALSGSSVPRNDTEVPHMTVQELEDYFKQTDVADHSRRKSSVRSLFSRSKLHTKPLRPMDVKLHDFYNNRALTLLVDNDSTMLPYWQKATYLMKILIRKLLEFNILLELRFTDPATDHLQVSTEKSRRAQQIMNALLQATPKTGQKAIDTTIVLLDIVARALEEQAHPKPKYQQSFLVFTSGTSMSFMSESDLIHERKIKVPREPLNFTLEFIHFGTSLVGFEAIERCIHSFEQAGFPNMVDAEAADGNIYKMLLGNEVQNLSDFPRGSTLRHWSSLEHADEVTAHAPVSKYCIPFFRNKHFVGQQATLAMIGEKLFGREKRQSVALVGLGGIGKTQVAIEFAYIVKATQPQQSIFWVEATSVESFEKSCTDISKTLGLRRKAGDDVKVAVQHHLNSREAGEWLMILDNADDREVLFGSSDETAGIAQFLPRGQHSQYLLTTRTLDLATAFAGSESIVLREMVAVDAVACLKGYILPDLLDSRAAELELLQQLQYLPLAITQAAAYMNRNQVPTTAYVNLLGNPAGFIGLMSREFSDETRYAGSANAVLTTWAKSFEQIRKTDSVAIDILSFASCIEPRAIPRSILPLIHSEEEMVHAIGTLLGYNFLANRRPNGQMFDVHRLVHLAIRRWLESQGLESQTKVKAIEHLVAIFPSASYENREVWREYLPHAQKLLENSEEVEIEARHRLCIGVGHCLLEEGRFDEAVGLYEHAAQWAKRALPEVEPRRLATEQALARAYGAAGRIEEATRLIEHTLKLQSSTTQENDPARLASEDALATLYRADGRVDKAIQLLERVISVKQVTLGEEHPSQLTSVRELASAYLANGQIQKAIGLLEHIVKVQQLILAEADPSRLTSQRELARGYLADGRIEEALALLRHVVEVQQTVLGEKHPSQLSSQYELGRVYIANGQTTEAVALLEHVVSLQEGILGPDHLSTLASQQELASGYLANGQEDKAKHLIDQTQSAKKTGLGQNHPSTLALQQKLPKINLVEDQPGKQANC